MTETVQFGDFRKTKTITLPGYPKSQVEIYDSVLLKEYKELPANVGPVDAVLEQLPKLIKAWNFVDKDGKPVPITKENVLELRMDACQALLEEVKKFNEEEKKRT